jgi:hypothetical protein
MEALMAILVDPEGHALDIYCPQSHLVSIVVRSDPLPLLYPFVRNPQLRNPDSAVDADGFAPVLSVGPNGPWHMMAGGERAPSVQVVCRKCRAAYMLDHADCLAGIALPSVKGRTPRITLRRVVAAKGR